MAPMADASAALMAPSNAHELRVRKLRRADPTSCSLGAGLLPEHADCPWRGRCLEHSLGLCTSDQEPGEKFLLYILLLLC